MTDKIEAVITILLQNFRGMWTLGREKLIRSVAQEIDQIYTPKPEPTCSHRLGMIEVPEPSAREKIATEVRKLYWWAKQHPKPNIEMVDLEKMAYDFADQILLTAREGWVELAKDQTLPANPYFREGCNGTWNEYPQFSIHNDAQQEMLKPVKGEVWMKVVKNDK